MIENIFLISLSVSPLILLLIFVMPFLRKRYSAKWGYWAWFLITLRLVIPFRPELPKSPINLPPLPSYSVTLPSEAEPLNITETKITVSEQNQVIHERKTVTLSIRKILTAGLISVGFLFLIYHLAIYCFYCKYITSESIRKKKVGTLKIFICPAVSAPIMTGFFRPKIFLPNKKYTVSERKLIILHELTHFRRKDLWYKLFLLIANSLHWFNPLIYWMRKNAVSELEYACDDDVIKQNNLDFRKTYSLTILKHIQ